MALKGAIISILNKDSLKKICRDLNLDVNDFRSRVELQKSISYAEEISAGHLLEYMSEKEIKETCTVYGISNVGRRKDLIEKLNQLRRKKKPSFTAIDFETADEGRDSACAVALVRVEGHCIIQRRYYLIRPPRKRFRFTHLHGITWEMVSNEPPFAELWPKISPMLEGIEFLSAHNAGFDQSVLRACCESNKLKVPKINFKCTMHLAYKVWKLGWPPGLSTVCKHLGIPLIHHYAASDAEACARIIIRALAEDIILR
jgi:DNA polymerase III subunit epsilon